MSKRVTTTGYIAAWVIGAIALVFFLNTPNFITAPTAVAASGTSPAAAIASLVVGIASLVMLILWIGALGAIGRQESWGWFAAVFLLQLVGLGILGMAAYAFGGPDDNPIPAVTRPSVT